MVNVIIYMTSIGHIYKIICTLDEKFCYIGSTFNRLSKRFEMHRQHYKNCLKTGKEDLSCHPYYKKYGIENFKIILMKSYEVCRSHCKDRKHLEAYETLWIAKSKCVNQHLPFLPLKRELMVIWHAEYREKNKEIIHVKRAAYNLKNKGRFALRSAEHYHNNKEKFAENYQKNKEKATEYYKQNKDKIIIKFAEYRKKNKHKVTCECGSIVTKNCLTQHKKSKKHQNFITTQ